MRILFINHFPLAGSGSGVYTANIAKSLVKKGNKVAIVFPENRREYEKYENIKLYPVFFKNEEIIPDVYQSNMNFPCFTTHPRSVFNFRNMKQEQKVEYERLFEEKIDTVIDEFKPDIVHAQHAWTLAGIAAKCCEKNKIPMIITCHGTDLIGIQEEMEKKEKWGTSWALIAIEYTKAIVTVSNDSKKLLEKILPEAKGKTILIKNGIDTNIFYMNRKLNKKDVLKSLGIEKSYEKVVCFVGKLTKVKGVDILLNATKKYEKNNIITLIAGDGELRGELENQAKNLKLENVKFLGNQPQSKLREIYSIADCSCVPSRKESFGLVAAEAMACGTPVIATNEGGLPDFVTPDVGILINVEDSTALAEAVTKILNKEMTFSREHISNKIKDNYSQDVLIDDFINMYKYNYS